MSSQVAASESHTSAHRLTLRRLDIDTYQESVIYMHRDCYVCQSEGFGAQ